jgi:hypothetical protein
VARKKLILLISRDHGLADVRYRVLVDAGFDVIAATDLRGVLAGCRAMPNAAMIGYSVPDPEKRRVWAELRKHRIPTLELYREKPVLRNATHHQSQTPEDFLETLTAVARQKASRAAGKGSR